MNVLVILAHPDKKSFNHAIAKKVLENLERNSHTVHFHDLYAEEFDPLLKTREIDKTTALPAAIQTHCEQLVQSDGIVIIHPNWWGQPPAILKGWIDRVIRPGIAYRFLEGDKGEGIPEGLLKEKHAVVINTSNTPEEREVCGFGDPLQSLWKKCIFDFCGVKSFFRKMYRVIVTSTHQQRERWLSEIDQDIQKIFSVSHDASKS